MFTGFLYGLGACFIWGTVYVIPGVLSDHSPLWISLLRYTVFGLFCAILLFFQHQEVARLNRSDWMQAALLGIIGNLLYYWVLSAACVRIGASLAAVFSAIIPLSASLTACLTDRARRGSIKRLAVPFVLIAGGLFLLNAERLSLIGTEAAAVSATEYAIGIALAVLSVVIWTWFPLANARWIKRHPGASLSVWTAAQGVAALPVAAIGYALIPVIRPGEAMLPDLQGLILILFLALACSSLGNLLWNKMSCRLPAVLVGQMIVFETLSAILYESLLTGVPPSIEAAAGAFCVLAGVSLSHLILSDALPSLKARLDRHHVLH